MTTNLFCLVDGDPTTKAFPVEIDPVKTVAHLKEFIKTKDERFEKIYAKNLNLWRVSVKDDGRLISINDIEGTKEELNFPTVKISEAFPPESLTARTIHVIVHVSAPAEPVVVPAPAELPRDETSILARELGAKFDVYPMFNMLESYLAKPLEKIVPVPYHLPPEHAVDLSYILQSGTEGIKYPGFSNLFYSALNNISEGGTENNGIYLWDSLIKKTLHLMVAHNRQEGLNLTTNRDKTDHSMATQKQMRPDFLCWLDNALVFKGEEKAETWEYNTAVEELRTKCDTWNRLYFGNLEYFFAYAAAGDELGFYAINSRLNVTRITRKFTLSNAYDRVLVVCNVINIFRCLQHFPEKLPNTTYKLYFTYVREFSKITFYPEKVVKKISNFDAKHIWSNFHDLAKIYKVANESPNIIHASDGPSLIGLSYVVDLEPIACRLMPLTLFDLKYCVQGVLRGLQTLHKHGFVHRDIRWENILQKADGSWMVIDLEHAGCQGKVDYHLTTWPRPLGSEDGGEYTPSCDLYLVGKLLEDQRTTLDKQGKEFRDKLLNGVGSNLGTEEMLGHSWLKFA